MFVRVRKRRSRCSFGPSFYLLVLTWHASNQASGIYFARFSATDALGNVKYLKANKLVLMK